MDGKTLAKTLLEATGLPQSAMEREFARLLKENKLTSDSLTLEALRELIESYLHQVLTEAKDSA